MKKNLNYCQCSGRVTTDAGALVALGWAGKGEGKNNSAMQNVHNVGPLPIGVYKIGPWEEKHGHLGPMVAALIQISGETYGRSAFYMHGADKDPASYGQESMGCIVLPRDQRQKVKDLTSGTDEYTMTVTA